MSIQANNKSKEIPSFVQGENIIIKFTFIDTDTRMPFSWAGVTEIYTLHPNKSQGQNIVRQKTDTPAVKQVEIIAAIADDNASLNDTYFLYRDDYYVLNGIDGGHTDPGLVGRIMILAAHAKDDLAPAIAATIRAAMNAIAGITATVVDDDVTVTSDAAGDKDDIQDGPGAAATGFTFAVTKQGADEIDGGVEIPTDGNMTITIPTSLSKDLIEEPRTTVWIAIDRPEPEGRAVMEILDAYAITKAPQGLPDAV